MNLINFIKLQDEKENPVYIKVNSINAIYVADDEKTTNIDYGLNETISVKNTPDDIAKEIFWKEQKWISR